jgi:hypothetical protein
MTAFEFTFPLRVRPGTNLREHHMEKAARVKRERTATALAWLAAGGHRAPVPPLPYAVTFTRIAPSGLDGGDNLPTAFKSVQDATGEPGSGSPATATRRSAGSTPRSAPPGPASTWCASASSPGRPGAPSATAPWRARAAPTGPASWAGAGRASPARRRPPGAKPGRAAAPRGMGKARVVSSVIRYRPEEKP